MKLEVLNIPYVYSGTAFSVKSFYNPSVYSHVAFDLYVWDAFDIYWWEWYKLFKSDASDFEMKQITLFFPNWQMWCSVHQFVIMM